MAKRLSLLDKLFLYLETRETMMHVAGLFPFAPPEGAPPDFARRLFAELRASGPVVPPWNLKLATPRFLRNPLQAWVEDPQVDLDYHARHSALPVPGDERELGVLVSRLHSGQLDFHRPLWELHLIEGLAGGRFALYIKVHHALRDGISAMRLFTHGLSPDPRGREPMFFTLPEAQRSHAPAASPSGLLRELRHEAGQLRTVGHALTALAEAARGTLPALTAPLEAPPSLLNTRIGRNRRFTGQQYEMARLQHLAERAGGTLNDVIIAICAGALRRFLLERNALPDRPLVAFVPVNLRTRGELHGGNSVGAVLASMATDEPDPRSRLEAIIASTARAKEQLRGMSAATMLTYSAVVMAPFLLQAGQAIAGIRGLLPVNFNVCISNLPGPPQPLYLHGARLEGAFPLSIATHGMALNITCQSYAGTLSVAFVGCRDTLPHLQKLAVYTTDALRELEAAFTRP